MVVVGRLAGDVGVLAGGQVEALDEAELEQHVERPEDRRPADAQVAGRGRLDQVGRREVARLVGDERGDRPPRLGHAVLAALEGGEQGDDVDHAADDSRSGGVCRY